MKETDIQDIISGVKSIETLAQGNLQHWKYVLENANSIWKRCPHKVGDIVRLTKTPDINQETSWGWMGAKHFLVEGAIATVHSREFYDGLFRFGLCFGNETWIDMNGIKHPPDRLSIYCFSENWLKSANYDQLTCEAL